MCRGILLIIFYYLFFSSSGIAQDTTESTKKWMLRGYVKAMSSYTINDLIRKNSSLQLLHNRINFLWQPNSNWEFNAELRNRLFIGSLVREQPDETWLQNKREPFHLEKVWLHKGDWLLHSNLERFSLLWKQKKYSLRLGRQRINWGMNITWNPNDIFNSYSFLDFDYEERPGTDALRVTYPIGLLSSLEGAVALANGGRSIAALRYFFNTKYGDYQLNAGHYLGRSTIGLGWASAIGEAGLKGELQYFSALGPAYSRVNASVEFDYMTKKEWYWLAGVLLNSRGLNQAVADWSTVSFELSPENMMPGKWNGLIGCRKQWHPLWTSGCSIVYAPGMRLLLGITTLQYNAGEKTDFDFVAQNFFGQREQKFQSITQAFFLRFKYSF